MCSSTFDGARYDQDEHYFLLSVSDFDIVEGGWTNAERRVVVEHRWWPKDELRTTTETVYPEDLVGILRSINVRGCADPP
jgi:hypothetical protein